MGGGFARSVEVTVVCRFVTGVSASSISRAQVAEVKQFFATDQVDEAPSVSHGIRRVKR